MSKLSRIVLLAAIMSTGFGAAAAEPVKFDLSKLEVSAWWAPNPKMAGDFYKSSPMYLTYLVSKENERLKGIYSDYSDDLRTAGAFGAQASYSVTRRLDISLAAGMVAMGHSNYDGLTYARIASYHKAVFFLYPEIRFKYVDRKLIRMYSAFSFGMQVAPTFDKPFSAESEITVIGLSLGNAIRVFCEAGYGSVFSGFKFGAAYKF